MAPPNNPMVAKLAMVYSRGNEEAVNTFHLTNEPPTVLTIADLQNMANAIYAWWTGFVKPITQPEWTLSVIEARKLDPGNPLAYDRLVNETGTASAGAPEPASLTFAMGERTGLAGRKYRGRIFPPAPSSFQMADPDRFTSLYISSWISAAANLLSSLFTANFRVVIFHRLTNLFTTVLTSVIRNVVDSQKDRILGHKHRRRHP